MPKFKNVYILPKLNAPDSEPVRYAIELINQAVDSCGVERTLTPSEGTLIIAVGGDGTMLAAMRLAQVRNAYAFGVNMGNVGFLTELALRGVSHDAFTNMIRTLVMGDDITIERRQLLRVFQQDSDEWDLAVNEVSISQMYADAMVTYHLSVGSSDAGVHRANSLLISTATGSTAYALAAGGVLMTPEMNAVQIVPVAPTRLTSRPIVTSNANIEVAVWGDGIAIRTDGQVAFNTDRSFTQAKPYIVRVCADVYANVIHFAGWDYFDMLQQKLGWVK